MGVDVVHAGRGLSGEAGHVVVVDVADRGVEDVEDVNPDAPVLEALEGDL